jgi:diguanylate cyclase (GGDEF)-like protein
MLEIDQFDPEREEGALRSKRLVQMFWVVQLSLLLACLQQAYLGDFTTVAVNLVTALILVTSYIAAKNGNIERSAAILLTTLTAFATFLVWRYSGLRDEAMMIYPPVLMFALLLGNRRIFLSLWLTVACIILANAWVNHVGWHINVQPPYGMEAGVILVLVIAVTGYAVWMISSDQINLLQRLAKENARVKESRAEIARLINHDTLTSLPNRVLAQDRFEHALLQKERSGLKVCLMFLDLDNFKAINDSLGHHAGDHFLVEIANRLKRVLRQSDTLCRQGGDEFLIILEAVENVEDISSIAETLIEAVVEPMIIQEQEVSCTCSIGAALAPDDANNFNMALRKADLAMYRAKAAGKNGFRYYDQTMDVYIQQHMAVVGDLRRAIDGKQFVLHYQPQIDLSSGKVIGAEALIRWNHPQRGLVGPDDFIPLAERSGLIVTIGEWVIWEACQQYQRWQKQGLNELQMAVNISSVQLNRGDLGDMVTRILLSTGVNPSHLEFELTESTLIAESESLSNTLAELRAIGIRFAIDDFGTGYSNLAYLKKFKVENLKVDKSFVSKLLESEYDEALVAVVIQMAERLKLKSVAEGIENEATFSKLRALGCCFGQGFYWSAAMPPQDFFHYASAHSAGLKGI